MPVSEYGEIGVLLEYTEFENKQGKMEGLVIHWRIRKVTINPSDNIYGKKGDTIYLTSRGWVKGEPENVFMPTERERSLRPCIMRAINYANKKWPQARGETH